MRRSKRTSRCRSPASSSTMFLIAIAAERRRTRRRESTRWSEAANGHLAAVAGLARHGFDFDHAVGDFGISCLEQALDQLGRVRLRMTLTRAADFANFEHGCPDALVGMVRFAGDLFAAGEDGFDVVELNGGGAPFVSAGRRR